MIHYWTDSQQAHVGTKLSSKWSVVTSNFLIVRHHETIWKVVMGCNPIRGTVKPKVDETVQNGKVIIQDAVDFYEWSRF